MSSLIRHNKSKLPRAHMPRFTLIHIKGHRIITPHTRKQRNAPQSRDHGRIRHAESRRAEIVHADDDVAVFVLGRVEGEEAVFSFGEDGVEV